MSSIWEEMTGIRSHTIDEIREAVDKAVSAAQQERGAVSRQLEDAAMIGQPAKEQDHPGLADQVASMDMPAARREAAAYPKEAEKEQAREKEPAELEADAFEADM